MDIQRSFFICCIYVTTAFHHALRGEMMNDTIFLDSSMRIARSLHMRTFLLMKEGGAGISTRVSEMLYVASYSTAQVQGITRTRLQPRAISFTSARKRV